MSCKAISGMNLHDYHLIEISKWVRNVDIMTCAIKGIRNWQTVIDWDICGLKEFSAFPFPENILMTFGSRWMIYVLFTMINWVWISLLKGKVIEVKQLNCLNKVIK